MAIMDGVKIMDRMVLVDNIPEPISKALLKLLCFLLQYIFIFTKYKTDRAFGAYIL